MSRRLPQPADLSALCGCAPDLAQVFVTLASDIALVIDSQGVVLCVAQNPDAPMSADAERWVGRRWVETVTEDTRRKVERLLSDVSSTGVARRREVNHASGVSGTIPVAYTALRLGEQGPVLVVGRDLRTVAAIQQRFLGTQQEIERSYWRARQSEARQRLLMQVASDAVVTVDSASLRVLEANAAAAVLFQAGGGPVSGRTVAQQFDAHSRPAVQALMAQARSQVRPAEIQARLAGSHLSVGLLALPLLARPGPRLLLRARASDAILRDALPLEAALGKLVEGARDGVFVTDASGQVLAANRTVLRWAQADDEDSLRMRPWSDWLAPRAAPAQPGSGLSEVLASVRERGIVQGVRLQLRLRMPGAGSQMVELAGMLLIEDDLERLGFILRPQAPEVQAPAQASTLASTLALTQAIVALTAQVARLKRELAVKLDPA